MPGTNMYTITTVSSLIVTLLVSLSYADERARLRCYICVTDYKDNTLEPGCSISSTNVVIRACAVQHGYDRCISYQARNTKNGNVVFRRHCATREMCEYQCLFSHHTNCQKSCCHGDLCNDVNFGGYIVPSTEPKEQSSTTKDPVTSQSPPTSTEDPNKTSKSPHTIAVSTKSTTAAAATQKISTISTTTEETLVGGPPITSGFGCRDYRDQCSVYAAYEGYCQYTRYFMLLHCPRSCQFCGDTGTTTVSTESPTLPTESPTTTSVEDTTQNVRTTSGENGFVGGPTGCVDVHEQCPYHISFDGYCQYHYGFMLTYCSKSCSFCDSTELPESPVKKATTENLPLTTSPAELGTTEQLQHKPTRFGPGGEDFENSGCLDLRENCTFYATQYEDYCNYNKDFMEIYCPFSCGFCGASVPGGVFPHPPVFHQHTPTNQEFPAPPSKKDVRWLSSSCGECYQGYQECIPKCILLLKDGIYEPTSNDVCTKLLGKQNVIVPC